MKYGKYEYERTYLLDDDCLRGKKINSIKTIIDKYINGTRLRLRKVEENNNIKYKLTKKENLNTPKSGIQKINTLYLSSEEFEKINLLSGMEIRKKRYLLHVDQIRIGIDKIVLQRKVIFIAEVEFKTEKEMNTFKMPLPTIMEITEDMKYSGFEIAKEYFRSKNKS